MIDLFVEVHKASGRLVAAVAMQFLIWSPIVYLAVSKVRTLSTAGRWRLVRAVLIILFLPFVLIWKVATAGSDCSCCCDEDD